MPCNNCSACMMNDCGECKFCLDKRKFGGPGKLKKRCELRTCVVPSANPIKPATPAGMKTTAMKTLTIKQKQPEMRGLDLIDKKDSSSGLPRRRRSLRPSPQCRFYKRNVVYKVQRAHLLWYNETKALRWPDLN